MHPSHSSAIHDIAIAGGGMVGLALAIALARENMRVLVIERHPAGTQTLPEFDGRVCALALSSKRLLERLGAWAYLAPHAQPIADIRVVDGDSPFFLDFHYRDAAEEPFGWIAENRYTRLALAQAASGIPGLTWKEGVEITSFHTDGQGVGITLSDGTVERARLLAAADGKRSRLRELAGIGVHRHDYRQTAIVCTIEHEHAHHGLALERFLPDGPFAVLPMTENRSSLVWVEPEARAPAFTRLSGDELNREIRARTGNYLGATRALGRLFTYPLSLSLAKSYTAPRFALVGDAAHGIHPLAGQGVNLGFRDVAALHEAITARFRLGLDIGDSATLSRYARRRHLDNLSMIAATHGLNGLFLQNAAPVKLARRLGLWGVGHLPPLKKRFMRHAMGIDGDVPPLMRPLPAA